MNVGQNIALLRRKRGWTQAKLAEVTGLSTGYVAAVEEGRTVPLVKTLAIIAHSLEVELEELYREDDG